MSDTKPLNTDAKYAWREVPRTDLHKRSASERLADFLEIYGSYDEQAAREQAARCIQCPDPQCVEACPLGNRIPEWMGLTAEGRFSEAVALLQATGSLPEIASRICPADRLCEGKCILTGKTEPVSIWAVEQFLNEYAFGHGEAQTSAAPPNGLHVAVIGAGPSGLTCADLLSQRGYSVTVFDWRMVPGGMLVSGTAAFRLERSIVERRIGMLQQRGVEFRLGVTLGEDFTVGQLVAEFDATFLGFGARKPRELEVPGRHLKGVSQALAFLAQAQAGSTGSDSHIEVAGKRVVVLGGGDMALDCLRTALRSGASEAVGVYRRDAEDMTASHGEYDNAIEEGVRFIFLAVTEGVLGNAGGEVVGIRLIRTEIGAPEATGRRSFHVLPGAPFEIPTDLVFLALGFEAVRPSLDSPFGVFDKDANGAIMVHKNQMTSIPGVFAGGDLVRGPTTVLNMVHDARRAADGIHRYLFLRQKA